MKIALRAIIITLLFAACQKDLSVKEDSINGAVVSSDALAPLPCHTTAFSSNYPVVAGQIPPFRFTKTLYSDNRLKTINVLSRAFSVHPQYKKQAYEIIGTFTYGPNQATLKGTRQLWEYYKTSTGAGARRSIAKKNISLTFLFNSHGYCFKIKDNLENQEVLNIEYDQAKPSSVTFIFASSDTGGGFYYPNNDQYGNNLSYDMPYNRWSSRVKYTYDYTIPRNGKNYSFIPTQNLISQEYSLCEVLQYLPQPTHQRKSVTAEFYPYPKSTFPFNTGQKVLQTQTYKNYKFDTKGNQVSLTYADNVLQKNNLDLQIRIQVI